jgi:spore coat protein CotH
MYKILVFILAFTLLSINVLAQNFTDSNLPIVVIETDGGVNIPDEPKVSGSMKIIWHQDGSRNYMTDIDNPEFLNYDGRIGIERRGSSSQGFSKKPYAVETREDDNVTNNNVSLLGMPAENDWVLNSLAYDQTGIRDVLSYELSNRLGQYASRSVYCEVVINGDYKGLYVFMEKIKPDKGRVNIEKMDETCNSYPEVTGGYIVKADKTTGGDPVAWTMQGYGGGWGGWGSSTDFILHYPKPEDVTNTQKNYIHDVFNNLASVSNQHNTSITSGISSIIDIPSFVDFMMIAEFSSNVDVYSLSTFFHKDRCGKLRAGPVWDYNLAYGYDAFGNRSKYDVWQFNNQDNNGPKFWKDLFDTDLYRCYLARRWFELTEPGQPLNYDFVCSRIDEIDTWIAEAIERDNQRWNQMGQHVQYVNNMKNWIQQRINWLNQNIGSDQSCSNIDLPPLVISKIHYHPMDWWGIDGERLEFIEITNNGPNEVDLTGIYFRELGISYGFPNGSSIAPFEAILLCSDSIAFVERYEMTPFGQYTRHLSNKDENLVLADAWGNIIDEVHYFDDDPWPWQADGEGPYLELKDLDSDNGLAENWIIGHYLNTNEFIESQQVAVFPNPVKNTVHVETREVIIDGQLIDLTGNVVMHFNPSASDFRLDLGNLADGLYLLKMQVADGQIVFGKIVKQ